GFDYYHDDVDSFSSEEPVQGPVADDASYDLFGLYIQDEVALSRSFDVILGLRYNYAAADANSVLDPLTSSQVSIEDDWNALLGSLRFLWRWQEEVLHVFGGVSQGFRTPNLSDLTRLDSARSNEYEIPSPGLDPERSTSFELGVKSRKERLSAELAVFYTVIEDQIVRFPTGNTNGSGELEITKDNLGDGYVSGIELGAAYEMAPQWTVFGNAAYQYGRVDTYPTSAQVLTSETITRLMPFSAQAGVLWEVPGSDGWIEAQFVYAATADRLNTRDQSDTSRIPPGGTPEYLLAHVRAGLDLADGVTLNVAFENLGDVNYRVHGSGQNGPGRNLTLGLTLSF
ncbi:MAG: hemoglobin/transferrin/lactoferrin receptor protein, partial [Candidatus Paceibacteria bacterium]